MEKNNCKKCGAVLSEDAAFCEDCGAKISSATPSSIPVKGNIIKILVTAIVATVSILCYTGVIGGKKPISGEKAQTTVATVSTQTADSGNEQSSMQDTSGKAATDTVSTQTADSGNEQTAMQDTSGKAAIDTNSTQTADSSNEQTAIQDMSDEAAVDNTTAQSTAAEKPTPNDFTWFTNRKHHLVSGIFPINTHNIENTSNLNGTWKGILLVQNEDQPIAHIYFTVHFTTNESDITAAFTWYETVYSDDGSTVDISKTANEAIKKLSGKISSNGSKLTTEVILHNSEENTLNSIKSDVNLSFYTQDNKEYAEGTWTVQDQDSSESEQTRIALVRQ